MTETTTTPTSKPTSTIKFDIRFPQSVEVSSRLEFYIFNDGDVEVEIDDKDTGFHRAYTSIETMRQIVTAFDFWKAHQETHE